MKAFKFFSILFAVLTILIGFGPIIRDTSLAEKIDNQLSILRAVSPVLADQAIEKYDLPSVGILYLGLSIVFMISVLSVLGIVMVYRKDLRVKTLGIILLLLAIASIIIHPEVKVSENGGASPRLAAMLQAVPAMLTGFFMMLYAWKRSASAIENAHSPR